MANGPMNLWEKLTAPFYSQFNIKTKEKDLSQSSAKYDLDDLNYVEYSPFSAYGYDQQPVAMSHSENVIKWRRMTTIPEVDDAITEIVNEALVFDDINPVIDLDLSNLEIPEQIKEKMHKAFDKVLFMLNFNKIGDAIFRRWYTDGVLNIEVVYDNEDMSDGIQQLNILKPRILVKKFIDENDPGRFIWTYGHDYAQSNQYNSISFSTERLSKTATTERSEDFFMDEQISAINSGVYEPDRNYPLSQLYFSQKVINQLQLIEDSLIIFRLTRSPEKRVFKIDVGNLPKPKAEAYVKSLIDKYRQKKTYNIDTGSVENKTRSISIIEDFWFPVSQTNGKGSSVEMLGGSQASFAADQMNDLNYFYDKVYKALKVPVSRRKGGQESNYAGNRLEIENDELKFFKYILKLRRVFNNLFVDLLKKELISTKVFDYDDWQIIQEKINFKYANDNEIFKLKQLQLLDAKMNTAQTAINLMGAAIISTPWIQKNIMSLTDEEIEQINRETKGIPTPEGGGGGGGGFDFGGGGGEGEEPGGTPADMDMGGEGPGMEMPPDMGGGGMGMGGGGAPIEI